MHSAQKKVKCKMGSTRVEFQLGEGGGVRGCKIAIAEQRTEAAKREKEKEKGLQTN